MTSRSPGLQERQAAHLASGEALHSHFEGHAETLAVAQHLHVEVVLVLVIVEFRVAQPVDVGQLVEAIGLRGHSHTAGGIQYGHLRGLNFQGWLVLFCKGYSRH